MLELENGGKVIALTICDDGCGRFAGVVLADFSSQLVTWRFDAAKDEKANCYWGHYFSTEDFKGASADFKNRSESFPIYNPANDAGLNAFKS